MAAIAVPIAGWVVSPIISKLLNEGFSYLGLGDADIKQKLENLEISILPQFYLVIEAAERSNDDHKAKLQLWLRKLKDAMYEAEDMLDLYKYQLLEKKERESEVAWSMIPSVKGKEIAPPHYLHQM
ncbi:uncharacterized protein [Typha angustifolia]|uniref:uncharacterized protein n=1 Tax=Typha angustifolia TaxID=59011 RepID=UPI003C2B1137